MTPCEIADDMNRELNAELRGDPAFLNALVNGAMTDEAYAAIETALYRVIERREQMKHHYLEDSEMRESLHKYYMARSVAGIAAKDAFNNTMKELG